MPRRGHVTPINRDVFVRNVAAQCASKKKKTKHRLTAVGPATPKIRGRSAGEKKMKVIQINDDTEMNETTKHLRLSLTAYPRFCLSNCYFLFVLISDGANINYVELQNESLA